MLSTNTCEAFSMLASSRLWVALHVFGLCSVFFLSSVVIWVTILLILCVTLYILNCVTKFHMLHVSHMFAKFRTFHVSQMFPHFISHNLCHNLFSCYFIHATLSHASVTTLLLTCWLRVRLQLWGRRERLDVGDMEIY